MKMNFAGKHALSLLILLLVSFISSAIAQEFVYEAPLIESDQAKTIDELIDIALNNQSTYVKSLQDQGFAQYSVRGAYGAFLPYISASAGYDNVRTESTTTVGSTVVQGGTDWSSSSSLSLSANENLFAGGSKFFNLKKARLLLQNAQLGTKRSRDLLAYNVQLAAFNLLSAKESLAVAKEVLEQQKDNLRYARARFESGDVIELDVFQAEIDLGTQENLVLEAEQGVENAREMLHLTMGVDLDSHFELAEGLNPVLPNIDQEILVEGAYNSRPDYKTTQNLIKTSALDVKIYSTDYLPSIDAYAAVSRSEGAADANKFFLLPDYERRSVGLSVSWTLFDNFRREISRQNAVVNKRKAEWDERNQRQQIQSNIRRQWRTLSRVYQQIQVTDKNRDLARRQLELEQERYRLGASSQLNLRNAQVTFSTAENSHIAKVLEFYNTLAEIELELGMRLEEIAQ